MADVALLFAMCSAREVGAAAAAASLGAYGCSIFSPGNECENVLCLF